MNTLPAQATATSPAATPEDLQSKLQALTKYGRPRLSLHEGGWHCAVDMFTDAPGAKFEVTSGFNRPTPEAAVDLVATRIRAAISTYGAAK